MSEQRDDPVWRAGYQTGYVAGWKDDFYKDDKSAEATADYNTTELIGCSDQEYRRDALNAAVRFVAGIRTLDDPEFAVEAINKVTSVSDAFVLYIRTGNIPTRMAPPEDQPTGDYPTDHVR